MIISFNAKIVEAFKKSLGNLPKNDWIDAFTIAERLRFGRLPKSCPVDFRYLALQRLTRHRFHIVDSIVREKNYFLSNLFLKFSGLCQNKVFSSNFSATATQLFDEFLTLDDIAARPLDELVDFMVENGKALFSDPKATAIALKDAVRKSYRMNASVDNSLNFVIKSCLDNIQSLEKQKKAAEKAIVQEIAGFNNQYLCLTSVKGIGPTIAAGLISEIGGISRFENDNALAKFSGIYWSEYQSADFIAEDTYLKRTGNEYLRYYFIQAADQLRKYVPEFSQYYARKFKEAKTHKHKRALVLTARKAVRLVFALLREEKLYKPPAPKGGINEK
jgi:transposase